MIHNNARIGEIINVCKATSLTRDGLWMIFNPVDQQGAIIPHAPIKPYKKPENYHNPVNPLILYFDYGYATQAIAQ
ncbi:hypothetical protein [Anabaena sp. UHCC 0204]|uniref:hypothetical protein n=1 Tax=Anabaena sp. UHCC 0204 TaxID=2590009 RepID=UPI001447E79D|nr:hypothetical protein [Anabaena sp. UHCC 0204]MTJ07574.1 hypothetical protein [Anabaena sp. UHCC 0204]